MTGSKSHNSIITTLKGNHYYADRNKSRVLFLHPILKFLMELKEKGELDQWLDDLPANESALLEIEPGLRASPANIRYYGDYLLFLETSGYFEGVYKKTMSPHRYKAADIRKGLANTSQIVFETTEKCSLNCTYCGCGEIYSSKDKRENRDIDPDAAKKVLDYVVNLLKSPFNRQHNRKIAISFYGGEPLLNFSFIEDMVRYAGSIRLPHNQFHFSMTTNGVLLDKYMDFLVEHRFSFMVSLDGNREHNRYRCYHDGRESFPVVFANLKKLKRKYPDYFAKYVNFATVLHDKNPAKEVIGFFEKELEKLPFMMEVNSLGIRPEKMGEYEKMFRERYADYTVEDLAKQAKDKTQILSSPYTDSVSRFLDKYSGCVYLDHERLLMKQTPPWYICTGTCDPFERKIFVTAQGKILPCERILHQYAMGHVDENGVHLDFEKIAAQYNGYYQKIINQCNTCDRSDGCPFCLFTIPVHEEKPVCKNKMNRKAYIGDITQQMSLIEESKLFYPSIMRKHENSRRRQ